MECRRWHTHSLPEGIKSRLMDFFKKGLKNRYLWLVSQAPVVAHLCRTLHHSELATVVLVEIEPKNCV